MADDYDYDEPGGYGPRILWGRIALLVLALLTVFVVGRCTAGGGGDEEQLELLQEEVDALRGQRDALEAELEALQGAPSEDADNGEADGEGEAEGEAEGEGGGEGGGEGEETAMTMGAVGPSGSHEVTAEDTLFSIAEQHYGDGALFTLITEANNLSRDDPLRVGQILDIPPRP